MNIGVGSKKFKQLRFRQPVNLRSLCSHCRSRVFKISKNRRLAKTVAFIEKSLDKFFSGFIEIKHFYFTGFNLVIKMRSCVFFKNDFGRIEVSKFGVKV